MIPFFTSGTVRITRCNEDGTPVGGAKVFEARNLTFLELTFENVDPDLMRLLTGDEPFTYRPWLPLHQRLGAMGGFS